MYSRFQFGFRWILALPVIAGVILVAMMTKHEPTALIVVWLTFFAQIGFVAGLLCSSSRAARVFGIGAAPPSLIGIVFAAKTILQEASDWQPSKFEYLIFRNLTNRELNMLDTRFRIGLLLVASLVGGIVAVLTAWLTHMRGDTRPETNQISN